MRTMQKFPELTPYNAHNQLFCIRLHSSKKMQGEKKEQLLQGTKDGDVRVRYVKEELMQMKAMQKYTDLTHFNAQSQLFCIRLNSSEKGQEKKGSGFCSTLKLET